MRKHIIQSRLSSRFNSEKNRTRNFQKLRPKNSYSTRHSVFNSIWVWEIQLSWKLYKTVRDVRALLICFFFGQSHFIFNRIWFCIFLNPLPHTTQINCCVQIQVSADTHTSIFLFCRVQRTHSCNFKILYLVFVRLYNWIR